MSIFGVLFFSSQFAQAYWVNCKCFACEGPSCQSLLDPVVRAKCQGPTNHCGREMGYSQISEVEVETKSKDYDHVIMLLQIRCAEAGEEVLGSSAKVHYAIEEKTCVQRFNN